MDFKNKLQILRTEQKLSQEDLACMLNISRQSVTKWENGQAFPDIQNLIMLSEIFTVSIDRLVKDTDGCVVNLVKAQQYFMENVRQFLVRARNSCYITDNNIAPATRHRSHDFQYSENNFLYIDSFFGTEKFGGEEIVWIENISVYLMNYYGHVLGEGFDIAFLKEALSLATVAEPYRGPEFYQKDGCSYRCKVNGTFDGFSSEEQIFLHNEKVYECCFHGGCLA